MSMVSFTSASTTKLSSQTTTMFESNSSLRDVSFSSYLSSADEAFVRTLADSSRNVISTKEEQLGLDGEIGVFGAERYFNGRIDEHSQKHPNMGATRHHQQCKKGESDIIIETTKPQVRLGTPSTRSESSWNSQRALLQNPSHRKAKKVRGRSFLGSLGCKCVCSDKNSVDIVEDKHVGEISFSTSARYGIVQAKPLTKEPIRTVPEVPSKQHRDSWTKEEVFVQKMDKLEIGQSKESCFSFPNPSPGESNLPVKMQLQLEDDQKARKSLEVFGSPIVEKRNKSFTIESRLAKLSWEANPRILEEIEFAENGAYINDSASDASSDLFEIESLTGKANPFLSRQASDVPSGCVTPTNCYAPSEASIEWSVVTASAADYSAFSDCEEQRPTLTSPINAISSRTKSSKEMVQRRRPNILLSCKSHKSVRVAGDAYIVSADHSPRTHRGSGSMTPVTRFHAGNKMTLTGFDSINGQNHGLAKHQLPRTHSPRASHLLYIQ